MLENGDALGKFRLIQQRLNNAGNVLVTRNGQKIALPETGSMTLDEALVWYRQQAEKINTLLDEGHSQYYSGTGPKGGGEASKKEAAVQSKYWQKQLKLAQLNAINDPNDAMVLAIIDPITTLEDDIARLGPNSGQKGKSGSALWKAITQDVRQNSDVQTIKNKIDDYKNLAGYKNKLDNTCFIAGTLIHTPDGLVPIEKIKVGDLVLSQPENKGEQSYKRVTCTFMHKRAADLHFIRFLPNLEEADARHYPEELYETLVTTGNHPFFVKGKGWTTAFHLYYGNEIELADGSYGHVDVCNQIFQSPNPHVGWAPDERKNPDFGYYVDLGDCRLKSQRYTGLPSDIFVYEKSYYKEFTRNVYNFEVEDNHTYYVGKSGLWVHNKNTVVLIETQANELTGSNSGRVFYKLEKIVREANGDVKPQYLFEQQTNGARIQILEDDFAAPAIEFGLTPPSWKSKYHDKWRNGRKRWACYWNRRRCGCNYADENSW